MAKPKILLVEDEEHLAYNLILNLEAEGFDVIHAKDGKEGYDQFKSGRPYHVILMDVMLPEMNGFEVVKKIRREDSRTGILMLTARARDKDRIKGLGLGADDYITKPFHLEELLIKVKRTAERADLFERATNTSSGTRPTVVEHEVIEFTHPRFLLNTATLRLKTDSTIHTLTVLEAEMLRTFIINKEKVLSRNYLLDSVWKVKGAIETRTVDNFIVRLRRYIEEDPANPKYLISVRGRGYQLLI